MHGRQGGELKFRYCRYFYFEFNDFFFKFFIFYFGTGCSPDRHDWCPYWASEGYCTDPRYSTYMNTDCQTSCKRGCLKPRE